jgi:hypothetical protein
MSFSCLFRIANQKTKLPMSMRRPMATISLKAREVLGCLNVSFIRSSLKMFQEPGEEISQALFFFVYMQLYISWFT